MEILAVGHKKTTTQIQSIQHISIFRCTTEQKKTKQNVYEQKLQNIPQTGTPIQCYNGVQESRGHVDV